MVDMHPDNEHSHGCGIAVAAARNFIAIIAINRRYLHRLGSFCPIQASLRESGQHGGIVSPGESSDKASVCTRSRLFPGDIF